MTDDTIEVSAVLEADSFKGDLLSRDAQLNARLAIKEGQRDAIDASIMDLKKAKRAVEAGLKALEGNGEAVE